MQSDKFGQQIVQQEIALDSYLSTLLDEIPSDAELDQVEIVQTVKTEVKTVKQPELNQKPVEKKVEQPVKQENDAVKILKPLAVMPGWAKDEFQALFFKVDKLILATPLTELLRTIKIDKAPTKIPGQPSWFMGLLDTNEQRIGVLDTGQLIYGKSRGQQRDLEKKPFQRILITHDGRWGPINNDIVILV